MKYLFTCILLGLGGAGSFAQVVAGRQVIGTLGASSTVGQPFHVAVTAGEAVAGSQSRGERALTMGFQQPNPKAGLQFELSLTPASCPTSTDGFAEVLAITGCSGPYTIVWSNGITGAVNDRLAAGGHSFTITGGGCSTTYAFEIGHGPLSGCVLRFFTAFSPNGDMLNDTWVIENIERPEFSENEVQLFNRWGVEVWRGKRYDNRSVVWDGKDLRGRALPPGTYFFVAEVAGVTHKGYVEITL